MTNYLVELYSVTETLRTTLAAADAAHAQQLAEALRDCLTVRPGGEWTIADIRAIG